PEICWDTMARTSTANRSGWNHSVHGPTEVMTFLSSLSRRARCLCALVKSGAATGPVMRLSPQRSGRPAYHNPPRPITTAWQPAREERMRIPALGMRFAQILQMSFGGIVMSSNFPDFKPSSLARRVMFEVPWDQGKKMLRRLTAAGIPATLWLDPWPRRAAIEVPADIKRVQILAALGLFPP